MYRLMQRERGLLEMPPQIGGRFRFILEDVVGRVRDRGTFKNGVTNAGINDLLNTYFLNGTVKPAFYLGLVQANNFGAFLASDTMASHPNWTEDTGYTESGRPQWLPATSTAQLLSQPTYATFSINAAQNYQGIFVCSDNTKGGTAGVLWAHGSFVGIRGMNPGEKLKVYYDLPLRAAS